eukprot:EG_transcript_28653
MALKRRPRGSRRGPYVDSSVAALKLFLGCAVAGLVAAGAYYFARRWWRRRLEQKEVDLEEALLFQQTGSGKASRRAATAAATELNLNEALTEGGAFQDEQLRCKTCGASFPFSAREQQFYAEKGFDNKPSRCRECQRAFKERQSGRGGRGRRGHMRQGRDRHRDEHTEEVPTYNSIRAGA